MTLPVPSPPSFRGLGEPPSAPRPEASVVALAADESVEAWSASAAVALARSWASPERPVRLVDLSVWSPRLDAVLGLEPGEGATDVVLFGADPAGVARRAGEGLEVVGAGKRVWDPARVMADGRLADLLAPPRGGLTVFLVPLDLPGCERALERAGAVVLLAPAHADAAFLLGDAMERAVGWWGPDDGNAPEGEAPPDAPRAGSRRPEAERGEGVGTAAGPRPDPRRPDAEGETGAGTSAAAAPGPEPLRPAAAPPHPKLTDTDADAAAPTPTQRAEPDAAAAAPTPAPGPDADEPAPPHPKRTDADADAPAPAEGALRDPGPPSPGSAPPGREGPSPAGAGPGPREARGRPADGAPATPPAAGPPPAAPSTPAEAPDAPGPVVAGATPVLLEPRGDGAPGGDGVRGVVAPSRRPRGEGEGRWTILLAEDNDDHALLVQMSLRWASRKPVLLYRARNGDEAIRLLDGVTPDLLLLDLKMPGRTGLEVLEHVKSADALRRIPVAVLTSSDRDEDVERAYGLGGNHFLTKPDDPRKLQQQLRTLLDNLWELRSIRRGRGVMEATGVTAVDPPALVRHRAASLALAAGVLLALLLLAWSVGMFG